MSTQIPSAAELAELENELKATRAELPEPLRAKVLEAGAKAISARGTRAIAAVASSRKARLSLSWFAASVAIAAAVMLNLSSSAALALPDLDALESPSPSRACALSRALHEAPEACLRDLQDGAATGAR